VILPFTLLAVGEFHRALHVVVAYDGEEHLVPELLHSDCCHYSGQCAHLAVAVEPAIAPAQGGLGPGVSKPAVVDGRQTTGRRDHSGHRSLCVPVQELRIILGVRDANVAVGVALPISVQMGHISKAPAPVTAKIINRWAVLALDLV